MDEVDKLKVKAYDLLQVALFHARALDTANQALEELHKKIREQSDGS